MLLGAWVTELRNVHTCHFVSLACEPKKRGTKLEEELKNLKAITTIQGAIKSDKYKPLTSSPDKD